jgi:hypothetical protein
MKIEIVSRHPTRKAVWTLLHAGSVGGLVGMGHYGIAAMCFCLFIDAVMPSQ